MDDWLVQALKECAYVLFIALGVMLIAYIVDPEAVREYGAEIFVGACFLMAIIVAWDSDAGMFG